MRSLAFATPGPFRTELNGLVLSGSKMATTGLLSEYDQEGEDIEHVGERLAVVNDADEYVATVEVTDVRVCRFDEVPLSHAVAEGEGWDSVAQWRDDHQDYFDGLGVEVFSDSVVVCMAFQLINS